MAAFGIRIVLLLAACLLPLSVEALVRHYKFNVGALFSHVNVILMQSIYSRFKV